MPNEKWLPIENYEGIYEISNQGRFRGLDREDHRGRFWPGVIFMPGMTTSGYRIVTLCKKGKQVSKAIHKLVIEAFVGPKPKDKEAHHKNGDKSDNRLINLEYVTKAQNTQHAYATGLTIPARGETHYNAKLTEHDIQDIKQLKATGQWTNARLAKRFGVGHSHISHIVNNRTWKHLN